MSDRRPELRGHRREGRRPCARPGEQLEVFVARGRRPRVKAYGGEVESLTSAESAGVGIRVIRDHRQGFAHAGTLDDDVIARGAGRRPRQRRVRRARRVRTRWPTPDGVAAVEQDLWRDELVAVPDRAQGRAGPRARARSCAAATPGSPACAARVVRRLAGRGRHRLDRRHPAPAGGAPTCSAVGRWRWPIDGDETKTGGGSDVGPRPVRRSTSTRRPPTRSTGPRALFGATPAPSQRLTIVLEPRMAAVDHRHRRRHAHRRAGAQGPLALRRPAGRADRRPTCLVLVDDPTDPASLGADALRRRGPGLPAQRADRRRRARTASSTTATPAAASGTASTGSAVRGYRSTPGVGVPGAGGRARARARSTRSSASIDHGFLVQSMTGLHSGVNAGQRRLLGRRRGPDDPRRRARRAGPRGHHRVDPAAPAARHHARSAATSSGCRAAPAAPPSSSTTCQPRRQLTGRSA